MTDQGQADTAFPLDIEREQAGERCSRLARTGSMLWTALTQVARQAGSIAFVFFLATLLTFLLGALSDIGPAAALLGDSASPEAVAHLNEEFGLNQPLPVQYLNWIGDILHGDLGRSWFYDVEVATLIAQRLSVTLSVALVALVIGVSVGLSLGIVAALNRGTLLDQAITVFAATISALPPFVFSILLILVFSVGMRWLPSAGFVEMRQGFWPWLSHVILPGIALSLDVIADIARQLRSSLVSVMRENYITAAVVRGYSMPRIILVHAMRNALAPVLAVLALRAPGILGGAVVTESIFNMVGYAKLTTEAALGGDVPIVLGSLVVSIVIVLAFSLLVNLLIAGLQPAGRRRA